MATSIRDLSVRELRDRGGRASARPGVRKLITVELVVEKPGDRK